MIYTPRSQSIEAAPVELAGQRLYAVAVDGKAHLIDGAAFDLLFSPEGIEKKIERPETIISAETKPKREQSYRPPAPKAKPPADGPTMPGEGTRADKCLKVLREHGPLTNTELAGHVFGDLSFEKRSMNLSDLTIRMRKSHLIEKRTDPNTQLDKWHLMRGA